MKTLFILSIFATLASSAFAGEKYVPESKAKPLYQALAAALPEAREGFNNSESIFVENLSCISNEDEYRCTGKTIDGKELAIEGGDPVLQQKDANEKLDALWKAMKSARLQIESGEGYSSIELSHLACDHAMPGSGADSFACGYSKSF